MLMLIKFFSVPVSSAARALASSVFPTPVGPKNKKDAMGRFEL